MMPVLAKADTDTEAVIRNDVDDDVPMAVTVPTVEKLVRHARAEDRDAVAIIVRRQCMVILVERIVLRLLRVPRSAAIFILLGSFMFMDHRRRRAAGGGGEETHTDGLPTDRRMEEIRLPVFLRPLPSANDGKTN
jgi:hypothetical protein